MWLQPILAMLFITSCASDKVPINTLTPTAIAFTRTSETTTISTSLPDFSDLPFQPLTSKHLQTFVIFHLNQGREVSEINTFFDEADGRHVWIEGRRIDFDGDNEDESILTISFYPENLDNVENIFLVAKKISGQDQYEIVYSLSETANYIPEIKLVDDFDGDSLPDLIFTRAPFGNGTGADIFVVRFEDSKFIIDQVATTDLVINKILADTPDTNGTKNLVVTGFEPGWGSSGPGRIVEETYSISSQKYDLLQSRYLPGDYRIHVLQDAQIAYNAGEEELAVKLWEQAAYDQSLINFPSMRMENDLPETYQPAFALYRLYTYFLSKSDLETAQRYWMELKSKYPDGSPGGEFTALGNEAMRLLDISQDPTVVCDGIYEFLNSTPENASFLMEHWYWGDHNLDIVEFCPLQR
jgi:hypothetical protein